MNGTVHVHKEVGRALNYNGIKYVYVWISIEKRVCTLETLWLFAGVYQQTSINNKLLNTYHESSWDWMFKREWEQSSLQVLRRIWSLWTVRCK